MLADLPVKKNTCMEQKGECFIFACALRPWSFILVLLMLLSFAGLSASQFGTPTAEFAADRLALLSFKSRISDPSGALASWNNSSLHFCAWQGVRCRNHGGEPRVIALELESLNLAGTLSPSIGNLTFLRRLHLYDISLQGSIPGELGFLSHLRRLNLSDNSLGGTIPVSLIQNCSKLLTFSLSHNKLHGTIPLNLSNCLELRLIGLDNNLLEGEIPSDLGSLSKLQALVLWSNHLTGSIPPEIGNLASLRTLILGANHLHGTIPAIIGNLSSLKDLDLSTNPLAGAIPAAIWNLSSLESLALTNNHLAGAIPSDIGNLAGLTELLFSSNQLTGTIPLEIGNLVNLITLFLGDNHMVGTIPKSLGSLQNLQVLYIAGTKLEARNAAEWGFLDALTNCTRLTMLDISRNHLGGMLPTSIANLSKTLQRLNFYDNQITGSIPIEIGNFINLTIISMASNLLNGTIPTALGNLRQLNQVDLSRNFFVGEIPTTLGNLTSLNQLSLNNNELYGSIPPSLGKCPINKLNLASNKLTGTVPKEILSIPTLTIIFNISDNSLTGSLPSEVGNLRAIETIDVSNNKLSGESPPTIAECQVLQYLYMQGNLFQGLIPTSFSQLKGLQVLDISRNNFSGQIPEFLQSFRNMTYLNLSYNNLEGEVPKDGVFSNASTFSVLGNNKLCGGVPELSLPSCSPKKKHLSVKLIVIISVPAGISCIIFLIYFFVTCYTFSKSRNQSSITPGIKEKHSRVSFAEILRATNGFSPANLIGMGSFGTVYKGIMNLEGHKDVAVKVLDLLQKGASRSFRAECEALRNIRHRNLVKIITSCSSVDFQGNDFKALVFEFLPHGSLDKWLHPEVEEQGTLRTLSLIQRLNISIDVATALCYLHHHHPTPIVHCDLKPSNVLLDHDMVAHVGDFGLARFLNKNVIKSSQRSTNSATLKGSIGYAAPEYGMANKVSVKGDVYSFGILLLEMFTGKRPTDDIFKGGLNLHQYVEMALPEQLVEIIDPYLFLDGGEGEAYRKNLLTNGISMRAPECITSVLKVGIFCSKESPKDRMDIEYVTRKLHNIRDAFIGLAPWQE